MKQLLFLFILLVPHLRRLVQTQARREISVETIGSEQREEVQTRCAHALCPNWLKEYPESEAIFQAMMDASSTGACKRQGLFLVSDSRKIVQITRLCNKLKIEKEKEVKIDFDALAPEWLKELALPMEKFKRLQALSKNKTADLETTQCETDPGIKVVGPENAFRLRQFCRKLVKANGGDVIEEQPGSSKDGTCAAELEKLKKRLEGDFSSGRSVTDILQELRQLQQRKATIDQQLEASNLDLQAKIDTTKDIASAIKRGMKQRELRVNHQQNIKKMMGQTSSMRNQERKLMYDAVLSGSDERPLVQEDVFKGLIELVVRSTTRFKGSNMTWKEMFHKEMNPCQPVRLQKHSQEVFESWLPKLLCQYVTRPDFVDSETFQELVRDALDGKSQAAAFMTKLGFPSLSEIKVKAYQRLVSVKCDIFDENSGWSAPRRFSIGMQACQ